MFTDQSTELSLGASCRALDSVRADRQHHFWIAGTHQLSGVVNRSVPSPPPVVLSSSRSTTTTGRQTSTQLQIIQFHNDINEITVTASYDIDGLGVRKVLSCPYDKELVLVASEQRSSVTLYRLPSYCGDTTFHDNSRSSNTKNYDDEQQLVSHRRDDVPNDVVDVVATYTPEGGFGANIADVAWRYDTSSTSSSLYDPNMDMTNNSGGISINSYSDISNVGDVVTVDTNGHVTIWDINTQQQALSFDTTAVASDHIETFPSKAIPSSKVTWDPHSNGHIVAVTVPTPNRKHVNMISIFDLRCTKENINHHNSSSIMEIGGGGSQSPRAYPSHYGILDMDYNPNRPYMIGTACRDGTCKFYDVRYPITSTTTSTTDRTNVVPSMTQPVCVARGGHSHYCTSIRYNPFHDQLVVSTGTDQKSNLWRLSSCSSAPILLPTTTTTTTTSSSSSGQVNDMIHATDEDNDYHDLTNHNHTMTPTSTKKHHDLNTVATNVCVQQQYEYGDAVYTTAWGANDAWIYLTISYQDGKAVLQHVPSTEKYKILL
jgi:hypothetical protein